MTSGTILESAQHRRSVSSRQPSVGSSADSSASPINSTGGYSESWLDLRYHNSISSSIKKPDELEKDMPKVNGPVDADILNRIQGSMIGMAIGDALGAHVEFRPRQYLLEHRVDDLQGGGTWGLRKGQFTDDTSMALCLANSLVSERDFNLYDQLVRYKWWYQLGYMSSTGQCFDIGQATKDSIETFERRQKEFAKQNGIDFASMDNLIDSTLLRKFNVYCSHVNVAGNGALMRLAPVPLFFYHSPQHAVEYSGRSGLVTHGDVKAYDACRYYGALITAVLHGYTKEDILDRQFYQKNREWFGGQELCSEIRRIAEGSFKKQGGYNDGIRGGGYVVHALEAALWAFWSDGNSFETGVLEAVNLGDDTDTTAAIYGQLAGAYYGFKKLPSKWVKQIYARKFMMNLSEWLVYEGKAWQPKEELGQTTSPLASQPPIDKVTNETSTYAADNQSSGHEIDQAEKRLQRHRTLNGTSSQSSVEQSSVPLTGALSHGSYGYDQPDTARSKAQLAAHKTVSVSSDSHRPTSTIKNPSPKPLHTSNDYSRSIVPGNSTTKETRPARSSVASTECTSANGLSNDRSTVATNVVQKPPIDTQSQPKRTSASSMSLTSRPPSNGPTLLSRAPPHTQYPPGIARHHSARNGSESTSNNRPSVTPRTDFP